jgi:hypothetical protein
MVQPLNQAYPRLGLGEIGLAQTIAFGPSFRGSRVLFHHLDLTPVTGLIPKFAMPATHAR